MTFVGKAQPQKFSYQAVIRNSSGNPVTNQNVSLRFSIHDTTATGTVRYSETQATSTNAFGLVNVQVGAGTVVNGTFSTIPWSTGSKFLQVDADITGGTSYTTIGTSELTSVPFALSAPASSTIIPFASGSTITLSVGTGAFLGFGNSVSGIPLSATIDLSTTSNFAFSMPRSGIITGLSAYFTNTTAYTSGVPVVITASIYQSSDNSNTFTLIPNSTISLSPQYASLFPANSIFTGILTGLNFPVSAQTRLLLVFGDNSIIAARSIPGYASAGLSIQ